MLRLEPNPKYREINVTPVEHCRQVVFCERPTNQSSNAQKVFRSLGLTIEAEVNAVNQMMKRLIPPSRQQTIDARYECWTTQVQVPFAVIMFLIKGVGWKFVTIGFLNSRLLNGIADF